MKNVEVQHETTSYSKFKIVINCDYKITTKC